MASARPEASSQPLAPTYRVKTLTRGNLVFFSATSGLRIGAFNPRLLQKWTPDDLQPQPQPSPLQATCPSASAASPSPAAHPRPGPRLGFPEHLKSQKSFNSTTHCKGCGLEFPCYRQPGVCAPCAQFYLHCLDECPLYPRLGRFGSTSPAALSPPSHRPLPSPGLIRVCVHCDLKFVTASSLRKHNHLHHRQRREQLVADRPKWMAKETMKKTAMYSTFPDPSPCQGCGALFPSYRGSNGTVHSLAYYEHCLTQCPEYRALGRLRTCPRCDCLFLNSRTFGWHQKVCRF